MSIQNQQKRKTPEEIAEALSKFGKMVRAEKGIIAPDRRVLVWFSCGAASACAAKLAIEKYPNKNVEILYCNTLAYEHPSNLKFLHDVEGWIGREIKVLSSDKYTDIFDVFDKSGWLVGHGMARCSLELKKAVRLKYENPDDLQMFGLTADEKNRIKIFIKNNPELYLEWILLDNKLTHDDCLKMIRDAGIDLPVMYKLGYHNNNCIGCVKGQAGYWNKIRKDFPEAFERMAKQERKMGVRILKKYYLDELPEGVGRYETEPDISCGPVCGLK